MKFQANKNAAGINKHLNKGGLVKAWVHGNTNYDVVGSKLAKIEGLAGPQWKVAVEALTAEMLASVKGNANIQAIEAWSATHLAR